MSAMNDEMRALLTGYLEEQFAGRPDLLDKVVPSYPPGSKRGLRDNGVWAGALTRDNVELITTGIQEITPGGVVGADGRHHDVDVIVYGTGFHVVEVPHTDDGHRARRDRPPRPLG